MDASNTAHPAEGGVILATPPKDQGGSRTLWLEDSLPHLGMAYLLAVMRRHGVPTALIDAAGHRMTPPDLVTQIKAAKPKLVALTSATCQLPATREVIELMKTEMPDLPIVLGGWHATAAAEETLAWIPSLDFVIAGEGEGALTHLWDALASGDPANLAKVPGLVWRDADGIHVSPRAWVEEKLDSLPLPDFDGFALEYRPGMYGTLVGQSGTALPITSSRGCPYGCEFCFRTTGKSFRDREIGSFVEEIQRGITDYGARVFYVVDETFSLHRKRAMAVCEAIIEAGLHKEMTWVCETRPDLVNAKLLKLMRQSGCKVISYGIDSGNQEMQVAIGRHLDLDKARRNIQATVDEGIVVDTNFIIGHPYETWDTAMDTVKYALSIKAQLASFALLIPFPGTDVAKKAEEGDGLTLLQNDWEGYDKQIGGACETPDLKIRELRWLQRYAYLRFYSRPRQASAVARVVSSLGFQNVANFAYRTTRTILGGTGRALTRRALTRS